MNKLFLTACFALLLVTAGYGLNHDYNLSATVTSGAITAVDSTHLGLIQAIRVDNDSATNEVYIKWDGNATLANISTEADVIMPGESRGFSNVQFITPKLRAVTNTAPVRVTIIY